MESAQKFGDIDFTGVSMDIINDFKSWFEASEIYYSVDSNEINLSDMEFDELTESLKTRCKDIPHLLKLLTSTITTVDGQSQTSVMISLDKIQWESLSSNQKIIRWFGNVNIMNHGLIAPKLDGHAIKVKLFNRIIQKILTRGGQDVTKLLINHPDIVALTKTNYNIVHGELVLPKKTFAEKYSEEYANPRNAVGGVLKQDVNDLRFIACTDGVNPINDAGFRIWSKFSENSNVFDFYQKYKDEWYPFQIDGIVIGFKTTEQKIKDNFPLNLVSVKFPAPTAKTKVIGFEWSQKKSGNLTPMYLLEPTPLDGIIVTKANAYNHENIKTLHCGIGSEVIITKTNDIIPIVKKVLTRRFDIVYPDVEYTIKGKHLVAVDMQISIEYRFVLGLKLLEIEGIGDTLAQQIGSIVKYDIIELFNVEHKPDIRAILGGGKIWNKFEQFYQIKNIPLDQLIEVKQFNRVGKVLAKKFADIITGEKVDTSGIEKTVLLHVCKNEGFQEIKESMSKLKTLGINVVKPIKINDSTITYEMTGSPKSGKTKKDFIDEFKKKYPNSTNTTLNKNTTYLFVDDLGATSSKANKARKYNIPILTYEEALTKQLESNTEL